MRCRDMRPGWSSGAFYRMCSEARKRTIREQSYTFKRRCSLPLVGCRDRVGKTKPAESLHWLTTKSDVFLWIDVRNATLGLHRHLCLPWYAVPVLPRSTYKNAELERIIRPAFQLATSKQALKNDSRDGKG